MLTRRRFLVCSAFAAIPSARPVRLVVRGGGEGSDGAALALDEMQRTAALVGRALDRASHPASFVIELAGSTISAEGQTFHVGASDDARARAVEAWRADHPGSEPLAAVEWHPGLVRYGAEQLNQRYERRFGKPMRAAAWLGWMAVKAAADAQLRQVSLAKARFDGHKGAALYFGPDRHLVQPLCLVDERGALVSASDF